ncbi:MAG: signal recognition particle-docking protein FtsY [Tissierellia bacterium]|nr:signal recognition particle-docking protein FtsY [Tissierellia bacterium]
MLEKIFGKKKNKEDLEQKSTDGLGQLEKENTDLKLESEIKVEKKKPGLLDRLKSGLSKTRDAMSSSIDNLLNGKATIDDDLYDELEEILISADVGVETTLNIIDELRDYIADKHIRDPKLIKENLINILKKQLLSQNTDNDLNFEANKPLVILVIGVNGVGKTTTIGKLAHNIKKEGKTVTLAAADTFRAAAIQQLQEWADRADVELISHQEGADPASVVFDAIASNKSKNRDCLIIDTAGRLHNKKNLMNELEKINRIIDKQYPEASRETLLVLDATTGQNAIYQAKEFNKVTHISGLVLTKMDGTAKGGVVFPLQVEHKIPVKYIGIGEGIDNLEKFNPEKFVEAMF